MWKVRRNQYHRQQREEQLSSSMCKSPEAKRTSKGATVAGAERVKDRGDGVGVVQKSVQP